MPTSRLVYVTEPLVSIWTSHPSRGVHPATDEPHVPANNAHNLLYASSELNASTDLTLPLSNAWASRSVQYCAYQHRTCKRCVWMGWILMIHMYILPLTELKNASPRCRQTRRIYLVSAILSCVNVDGISLRIPFVKVFPHVTTMRALQRSFLFWSVW